MSLGVRLALLHDAARSIDIQTFIRHLDSAIATLIAANSDSTLMNSQRAIVPNFTPWSLKAHVATGRRPRWIGTKA